MLSKEGKASSHGVILLSFGRLRIDRVRRLRNAFESSLGIPLLLTTSSISSQCIKHSRVTGFFHTVSKLGRPCKATTSRLGNHFLPASSSTCKYCRSKCCNLARSPSSLGNEVIFVPDKSRCRNSTNSLMDTGISLRPVNDKSRTLKAGIKWRKVFGILFKPLFHWSNKVDNLGTRESLLVSLFHYQTMKFAVHVSSDQLWVLLSARTGLH
ncbi:hypothetical protein NC653_016685 [Populus alba x Populus x berolinensis]|nr:hypothetical protein NC653_016685 [Populus alba x Populus x berolinensis]